MTNATMYTPQEIIEQGRANNMQSAKRLLEIERLEKLNDELLEALKNLWAVCDTNGYEVPMGYRNQVSSAIAKASGDNYVA